MEGELQELKDEKEERDKEGSPLLLELKKLKDEMKQGHRSMEHTIKFSLDRILKDIEKVVKQKFPTWSD